MNIKYNVKVPERNQFYGYKGKSDEVLAVESFVPGKMKNMCFEYDTVDEAKKKKACLQAHRRKQQHQEIYDCYRVKNCVYIVRLEK